MGKRLRGVAAGLAFLAFAGFPSPVGASHNPPDCGVIRGTNASETLIGSDSCDDMFGEDGYDTVLGREGRDDLNGNQGRDEVRGERAGDHVMGNNGDDILKGGDGNDVVKDDAGPDSDMACGNNDADHIDVKDGASDDFFWAGGEDTWDHDPGEPPSDPPCPL